MINMVNGQIDEGILESQNERFSEDRFLKLPGRRLLTFDRTLLCYDNSTLRVGVSAN